MALLERNAEESREVHGTCTAKHKEDKLEGTRTGCTKIEDEDSCHLGSEAYCTAEAYSMGYIEGHHGHRRLAKHAVEHQAAALRQALKWVQVRYCPHELEQ